MARPLRLHVPGRAYHVHARGDNKGLIFHDAADYKHFLSLLERALNRFGAECAAFCLLDNHFHLLLIPHQHSISRIMQYVNGSYAQWFNRRHGRVGHVFQGRFGSKIIDDADYLLTALCYVAVNPVEGGLVRNAEDWPWSSHRAVCGLEPAPGFLTLQHVWDAVNCEDAVSGRRRYLAAVAGGREAADLRRALFVGGERLARQLAPRLVPYRPVIAHTYAERYATRPPIDSLFLNVDSASAAKFAAVQAFHVHAYTLTEIGERLGRDPSTVSKWIASTLKSVPGAASRGRSPDSGMPTHKPSG